MGKNNSNYKECQEMLWAGTRFLLVSQSNHKHTNNFFHLPNNQLIATAHQSNTY